MQEKASIIDTKNIDPGDYPYIVTGSSIYRQEN